jgi:hypothetical protein
MAMTQLELADGPSDGAFDTSEQTEKAGVGMVQKLKDAGNWIKEKLHLDKFARVAGEWKDDVLDTIKLNTVDKWAMLSENRKNNKLIARREREIQKAGTREEKLNDEQATLKQASDRELATFDAKLDEYKDPTLRDLLVARREEKQNAFYAKTNEITEKMFKNGMARDEAQKSIETFNKNIDTAKDKFTARLDGKIDGIREKYDYTVKVENRNIVEKSLTDVTEGIKGAEDKITQYENALETFGGDKELKVKLKAQLGEMRKKLSGLQKTESKLTRAKTKLDRNIARIDKKTEKYQTMKEKYGLVPVSVTESDSTEIAPSENSETPVMEVSPEENQDQETVVKVGEVQQRLVSFVRNAKALDGSYNEEAIERDIISPAIAALESVGVKSMKSGHIREAYDNLLLIKAKKLYPKQKVVPVIYEETIKHLADSIAKKL